MFRSYRITKAFWYKLVIDIDWDDVFEFLMEFKSFPHDPECAHDLQRITYILNVFCVGFDEIWVWSGGTKRTWAVLGLEKHVRHISRLHKQLFVPTFILRLTTCSRATSRHRSTACKQCRLLISWTIIVFGRESWYLRWETLIYEWKWLAHFTDTQISD